MRSLTFILLIAMMFTSKQTIAHATEKPCPKTLKISASPNYLPFSHRGADGKLQGLDIEFVKLIFDELGCSISFFDMPHKRAVVEFRAGRLDAMPFASITDDRKKIALFSDPYRIEPVRLVIRRSDIGRFPIKSIIDIDVLGMKLGHMHWTYRGDLLESLLREPSARDNFYDIENPDEGLLMLSAGHIDAVVEVPASTLAIAEQLGMREHFAVHPFEVWQNTVHLMFNRKTVSAEVVSAVNETIAEQLKKESYKKLYGSMAITQSTNLSAD